MFEQIFKNIDNILRRDSGCSTGGNEISSCFKQPDNDVEMSKKHIKSELQRT